MNAAGRGLPDLAESEIAQMREAGLPPGPRAYHALVFAYVRAKLPYEALGVAERVVKEGMRHMRHIHTLCTTRDMACNWPQGMVDASHASLVC